MAKSTVIAIIVVVLTIFFASFCWMVYRCLTDLANEISGAPREVEAAAGGD